MNRIRELRNARGLSQAKLGAALGCTSATVSKYELEQRDLDPKTINALCGIFDVTSDYLLCRSATPAPVVSDEDAALLAAYHAADQNIQNAIDALLQPWLETESEDAQSQA